MATARFSEWTHATGVTSAGAVRTFSLSTLSLRSQREHLVVCDKPPVKAKFHYRDPTRTRHGPDPTRTKSVHVVGYELNSTTRTRLGPDTDPTGPARTRTDFFCGETPLVPCGSGRVRVVEFSFNNPENNGVDQIVTRPYYRSIVRRFVYLL